MRWFGGCCALTMVAVNAGCTSNAAPKHPYPCREGPADDVAVGAKTAGQGVEAGVETGVAGVKQAGRAAGGLVTGGSKGAEEEWNAGKRETKKEAREGSDEIDEETLPRCPD